MNDGGKSESDFFLQQWLQPGVQNGSRKFIDVACAAVLDPATGTEDLHLFGVTSDGHLLRSVNRGADAYEWKSSFLGWEDVELTIGQDLGEIRHVDAASRPYRDRLAVVASTADGTAWYLGHRGGWQVRNIVASVNGTTAPLNTLISVDEVAVDFCDAEVPYRRGAEDDWELNILLQDTNRRRLLHTILAGVSTEWQGGLASSPAQWKPFTDILKASGYRDPRGTRTLAAPTIGEYPHLRNPVTIAAAVWKSGDFQVTGTVQGPGAVGATMTVHTSATGPSVGSATATAAVAPATGATYDIHLINGAAPSTRPDKVWVKSDGGGVAGPFSVAAG